MSTRTQTFAHWWRNIKAKPEEQQKIIFEKWLYYSCKTIANRGDQNQAKVVYTIATRYNKSKYKKMSKANARKVYRIVNNKQAAHKRQLTEIIELKEQIFQLQSQLANIARNPSQTKITTKKTRKVVHHGGSR